MSTKLCLAPVTLKRSRHWVSSSSQQGSGEARMPGANSSTRLLIVIYLVSTHTTLLACHLFISAFPRSIQSAVWTPERTQWAFVNLSQSILSSVSQEVLVRRPWGKKEPVRRLGQTPVFWPLCSARISAWNRPGFHKPACVSASSRSPAVF